jgi:hypothetical protein
MEEVNRMYEGTPKQGGDIGRVVLCSARDCSYNQASKCVAESVHVMLHQDHADCNTYTHNQHMQQSQVGVTEEMEDE